MNDFEKQLASQPLKSVPTEWRAQILKKATAQQTRDVPATGSRPLWWLRELLWPHPQAWGALAVVWIVIAVFKFTTPSSSTANAGEIAKNQTISLSEQRRDAPERAADHRQRHGDRCRRRGRRRRGGVGRRRDNLAPRVWACQLELRMDALRQRVVQHQEPRG